MNQARRKRQIAWSAIIVCLAVLLLSVWIVQGNKKHKVILSRCTNYTLYEFGILDCYGVLSIRNHDEPNTPYYEVFDHKNGDTVAYISGRNQFVVLGGYLYVINEKPSSFFESVSGKYGMWSTLETGESGFIWYDRPDQIPVYLKVETKTGIVSPYQNYDHMTEADRAIFRQLEKR